MKKTVRTIAIYLFAVVLAVFCLFTVSAESFLYARAESRAGESIETSDPLEDLEGAVIGGKQFSLDNYTWDLNGVPQLIYFAEVGYSMWTDNREDYALYAYIYNPAGLIFDEDSESNKIELAFGSGGYEKYPLAMIGKSQRPGYEGLFYKAEIALSRSQREEALGNLSSNERVYTITSMELSAGGALEDYPVGFDTDTQKGTVYRYTGYTVGYGSPQATESSLACTVEGFSDLLDLEVEQTVYRPEGDYYNGEQSQLNSCWFTVPNEYIERFGELSKIKYEWYEYVTKPILVTEDAEMWRTIDELHGRGLGASDKQLMFGAFGNTDSSWFGFKAGAAYYSSNFELSGRYHYFFDLSHDVYVTFDESTEYLSGISAAFYTGGKAYDEYSVSAEELKEKFLDNSEKLGDTSIAGKYAANLFEDYVQGGRTMGYNSAESKDELEIYFNTTTKSSLWQQIFGGFDVDKTWDTVSAFHNVTGGDLSGSDSAVAERLYIAESDVPALRERYESATAGGETVILFRYGSTAYYSMPAAQAQSSDDDSDAVIREVMRQWSYRDYSAYIVQETVFLNFDIISLTFTNADGVATEIAAVMTPEDVFSDTTPPLDEDYHTVPWLTIALLLACSVAGVIITTIIERSAKKAPKSRTGGSSSGSRKRSTIRRTTKRKTTTKQSKR